LKIQVGVCIALRDRLQLIGTYFYSIWRVISLFSKGNPLDAISHWLIENRYFKNSNPKLQASETPKFLC
jgi:hypothetical protein